MKTETVLHHLVGKTYKEVVDALSVSQDHGDCCGWSDHMVADCLKDLEEKDAAVLVNVVRIEYDESESDRVALNFIFDLGDKKGLILGHELSAGSGSGWNYGAYCTLRYDGEEIASASW